MHISAIAYVFVASTFLVLGINGQADYEKALKRIHGQVKHIGKTMVALNKMLKEVYDVKDKCYYRPGKNRTKPADIYAVPKSGKSGGIVKVEVTKLYDECLKGLNPDIFPPVKAKIWCLRVALWRKQNDLKAGDFEKGLEEAKLLQKGGATTRDSRDNNQPWDDTKQRKKRGALDVRQIAPADITRPLTGFRTRQEYRTLSLDQRNRLHAALNQVYQDGTMTCFALVHRNALNDGGAHRGHAFLPWHRVFLSLFEEALRQKDPSVSLPYWDSTLDDNMAAGPGFSIMWDNAHLGPGVGNVNAGPFANWTTAEGPLQRNVARGNGNLVRQTRINTLLNLCLLDEFTDPWESTHDSVHVWVGGTMERSFAAADPVFYMHHAFVDYVWERFRQRQRAACGVDPAADYPPDDADAPEHSAVSPMVAMDFLRNRDGIADYWINNWFNYTDSPTCANNCGNSPDLYCDSAINRCVSNSRFDFGNPVSTTPIPLTTATTTTVTTTTATTTTETTTTTRPTPIPITSTSESPRNTPTPPRNITTTRPPTPSPTPIPSATPSPITTTSTGPLTTTPIASCTDGGSYCRKVNEGQKPYEGKCSKDPYDGSCARRPRPATADAVVNAICRNELPRSPSLQAVFDAISSELKRAQRFPPESEQTWFRMKPDEEKDCRCLDSLIRDPLVAYLKEGRQLNQYGPKL